MRRATRAAVALAVVAAAVLGPGALAAQARERVACTDVRLEPGADVSGESLAQCLRSRMDYAGSFRTRIAASGDRTTYAAVRLDPTVIRATRGTEHVRVTSRVRRDEPLLATFVRQASPPAQLVAVARSVARWTVIRGVDAYDAEDRLRHTWRLVPVESARFDRSTAVRVSLHLDTDLLPVRFRATTTAVGIEVTYTQRWSDWGARIVVFCGECTATVDPTTGQLSAIRDRVTPADG